MSWAWWKELGLVSIRLHPNQHPDPVVERPTSLMIFSPEDHGTKCDICGAGMSGFGHLGTYSYDDKRMKLSFSCGQEWQAPSREDLYWTHYSFCHNATELYRALRNEQ